jgi:cytochrome c-type biogenesis protein CcmH/NrfG
MASESTLENTENPTMQAAQVYGMAVLCLVAGLAIGYLLRGTQSAETPAPPAARSGLVSSNVSARPQPQLSGGAPASAPHGAMNPGRMPSLEQMQHMADAQAQPLLEKLKTDPNDSAALSQLGAIYHTTHRFKQAAAFYSRAVDADPKNVALRTRFASSLYRSGDVDGAIAQLNRALKIDPKDANALFDLGMIRLQGKQDGKGAVAAWQQLLKSNPEMSSERRAQVQKLMADVMTTMAEQHRTAQQHGSEGAPGK